MKFFRTQLAVVLLILATMVSAGTTYWLRANKQVAAKTTSLTQVRVALPTLVSCGAFYVGLHQGYFAKRNLQVTVQPFAMGRLALAAVKSDNADLAVMADTAFMFSVIQGDKLATLGTVFASRRNIAIVSRQSSGIRNAHDLIGRNVATVTGTNNQYFLDALLVANHVDRASVNIVYLRPDELVSSLKDGKIDAATLWHPTFYKAQQALGTPISRIYSDDIFVFRFLLAGKSDYLSQHGKPMQDLLEALDESNNFIYAHPTEARAIIGTALGLDPTMLAEDFDPTNFTLSLDQTLLLALDEQTRWAIRRNLVPEGTQPNYLDFMRPAPLASVRTDAVKIIR
jgi:NitT/TauT family transport system substrate-binding protein